MATAPLPPTAPAPGGRPSPPRAPPAGTWLFGRYRLEPATRRLHADGRTRELDARALAVLECLLLRANRIVPRATLIAEAWPETDAVFDSAVSKVMRRLRTAMGDGHGHVLQTVYGEGYRLALPAVQLPPAPGRDGAAPPAVHSARRDASPAPVAPAADPPPGPVGRDTLDSGQRGRWLARLPWIIAAVATLAAAVLGWLLAGRPGA